MVIAVIRCVNRSTLSLSERMARALFSKRTRRNNHPRPAFHYQGYVHRAGPGLLSATQSVSQLLLLFSDSYYICPQRIVCEADARPVCDN